MAASSSSAMLHSSVCSSFVAPLARPSLLAAPSPASPSPSASPTLCLAASASTCKSPTSSEGGAILSRRLSVAGLLYLLSATPEAAMADIEDDYKQETQNVIVQVRSTLGLDKADPSRGDAVKALRQTSNEWVAKYRREKRFAGKPSYSNIYSVLNAVSGHFISYGDGAPLPAKRRTQILEEVDIAERALGRGR